MNPAIVAALCMLGLIGLAGAANLFIAFMAPHVKEHGDRH